MRLIDADALIREIQERECKPCRASGKDYRGVRCRACSVGDQLDDIQDSFTVKLEKQGKWLYTDAYPHHVYCSLCFKTYVHNKQWIENGFIPKAQFCPHCGARLKQEEGEREGDSGTTNIETKEDAEGPSGNG